jgi:hypothetical protein
MGMASQADVQDGRDEKLEQDRRGSLNPSLAREEPDTSQPASGEADETGAR